MIIDFKKSFKRKNQLLLDQIYISIEAHICQLATHAIWLCHDQYTAKLALNETIDRLDYKSIAKKDLENLPNKIYIELKNQCIQLCSVDTSENRKSTSQFKNPELIKALKDIPDCFNEPLAMQVISQMSNLDMMRYLAISEQELMRRLSAARKRLFTITQDNGIVRDTANSPLYA